MSNFEIARLNMVESQVRPNGITDSRILEAMGQVAREDFVPPERRATAYMDEDIELSPGRFLIEAMAFAKLLQLAEVKPDDKVLHVGAAAGYGTAVLSKLCAYVVAVETDPALVKAARHNLARVSNVEIVEGSLADGVKSRAPFDVILIEGRIGEMPAALMGQLAGDGRAVAVIGEADMAKACLWTVASGIASCRKAFDASIAALPGFSKKKPEFVF